MIRSVLGMSIKLAEHRTSRQHDLEGEVRRLRSLVIGLIGRDAEGVYRPSYAHGLIESSRDIPTKTFKGAEAFLKDLERV